MVSTWLYNLSLCFCVIFELAFSSVVKTIVDSGGRTSCDDNRGSTKRLESLIINSNENFSHVIPTHQHPNTHASYDGRAKKFLLFTSEDNVHVFAVALLFENEKTTILGSCCPFIPSIPNCVATGVRSVKLRGYLTVLTDLSGVVTDLMVITELQSIA